MVDLHRRMRLTALCNCIQERAGNHASSLGMGFEGMKARGQFWAMSRLVIQMKAYPRWLDTISVQTWVSSIKGPFSHRNFVILNEKGEEIGSASSLWALLDAEKRRPVRIRDHQFSVLEEKLPSCGLPEKLQVLTQAQYLSTHKVVFSDLDMIGHVNNGKYVEWMMDQFMEGAYERLPHQLHINYLQEAIAGESAEIWEENIAGGSRFELRKLDSEAVLCRAVIGD